MILVLAPALLAAQDGISVTAEAEIPAVQASPLPTPDPMVLAGRRGLSLVYSGIPGFAWSRWTSEGHSVRYGIGGSLNGGMLRFDSRVEDTDYSVNGSLKLFWASRFVTHPVGKLGHLFLQPGVEGVYEAFANYRDRGSYYATSFYEGTVEFRARLQVGAEIFWPESRDLSLETGTGVYAGYRNSSRYTSAESYFIGMDVLRWDAAINFYYR